MSTDDILFWVAFSHVPGIGPTRLAALEGRFGDIEAAWQAPAAALAGVLDARSLASLVEVRAGLDLDAALARVEEVGARVVVRDDPAYPPQLREIGWAPFLLYVRGDVDLLATPSIAVVGTRRASEYGLQAARMLAGDLAAAGVTIVSGLALGIDGAAHRAALGIGGPTIAVLGCGIDVAYPPRHAQLQEEIATKGAVVSEYPPGTPPDGGNFPARNRIVSGLAVATLVVEAGETSGALLTARDAAEQGRDVFAVPGRIFSPASVGTHALIAAGAGIAVSADDILSALDLARTAAHREARRALPADPVEARVLDVLGLEPAHIDELGRAAGMAAGEMARVLALLELKGLALHAGGMRWASAR